MKTPEHDYCISDYYQYVQNELWRYDLHVDDICKWDDDCYKLLRMRPMLYSYHVDTDDFVPYKQDSPVKVRYQKYQTIVELIRARGNKRGKNKDLQRLARVTYLSIFKLYSNWRDKPYDITQGVTDAARFILTHGDSIFLLKTELPVLEAAQFLVNIHNKYYSHSSTEAVFLYKCILASNLGRLVPVSDQKVLAFVRPIALDHVRSLLRHPRGTMRNNTLGVLDSLILRGFLDQDNDRETIRMIALEELPRLLQTRSQPLNQIREKVVFAIHYVDRLANDGYFHDDDKPGLRVALRQAYGDLCVNGLTSREYQLLSRWYDYFLYKNIFNQEQDSDILQRFQAGSPVHLKRGSVQIIDDGPEFYQIPNSPTTTADNTTIAEARKHLFRHRKPDDANKKRNRSNSLQRLHDHFRQKSIF